MSGTHSLVDASPAGPIRAKALPADAMLVIGRHGRPAVNRMLFMNAEGYRRWWANYDRAGLAEGQRPPARLVERLSQCATVWASSLPRALATARAAAPDREILTSPLFVEAPLPPPEWPTWVVAQPGFWGFVARIAWWLGADRGEESRVQAEARAALAVDQLERLVALHGTVGLVAHGWFNRMMRPELFRRGWECVEDGGDTYWSFRIYRRRAR
jgi:broad specificity phosphatase PhoE